MTARKMDYLAMWRASDKETRVLLGSGVYRDVYAVRGVRGVVFKIPHAWANHTNAEEFDFWRKYNSMPAVQEWCAPCLQVSKDCRVLVMARTLPLSQVAWRRCQRRIPRWIRDSHRLNFGWRNGRVMCHDYAQHNAPRRVQA